MADASEKPGLKRLAWFALIYLVSLALFGAIIMLLRWLLPGH